MKRPHSFIPARGLPLVTLLLAAAGCASSRPPSTSPAMGAPADAGADLAAQSKAAPATTDSTSHERAADSASPAGSRPPAAISATAAFKAPASRAVAESTSARAAAAPDTLRAATAPPALEISVELSPEEKQALAHQITVDLDQAQQAMSSLRTETLSAEDTVRLETTERLVADAERVRGEGDLRAAAVLAHKAKLLAEELAHD
jgi:hypothetical protein